MRRGLSIANLVLFGALSCLPGACSRPDARRQSPHAQTPKTSAIASGGAGTSQAASAEGSDAVAFGPRVDLAHAEATGAAKSEPPTLPLVDAPTLLRKIRASGNKGVVVNIWASFCDPCREELPMLNRVSARLAARHVPIWLVSVDDPEGLAAAKALLENMHIALPSFAAAPPLEAFKLALSPNWPGMIPVSFLFDNEGKLRYFWRGEVFEQELVPLVEAFATGNHIDGESLFKLAPGATR